ncbi:MAG: hypothetical protein LBI29_00350 [Rickettsiales bacterium]|jgi:hypothetical protein|nr:hypothetical protein [Rickettsiales bacterium]
MPDLNSRGKGKLGSMGLVTLFCMFCLLANCSQVVAEFRIDSNSNFGSESLVKNSVWFDGKYGFNSILIGLGISLDTIDKDVFQKYYIEPIANRKRAMELKKEHIYSLNPYFGYKIFSRDKNELMVKIGYYVPFEPDMALKFSGHNGIFRSVDLSLVCGGTLKNFRTAIGVTYKIMVDTFKNNLAVGFHSHYNIGKNATIVFSYDYGVDLEKSDYKDPPIPYVKPDNRVLYLKYDNINYSIPKKLLLRKFHQFTLANLFRISEHLQFKLGVGCSIDKYGDRGYHMILGLGL